MNRIARLEEFLRENPRDSFVKHALALEWIREGDELKARSLFESLLADEPGYVGSYYHLAMLLERNGETDQALRVFEKGMEMAKEAGDKHAYNELRSAYEELNF